MPTIEQDQHPSMHDVEGTMKQLLATDDILRAQPAELARKLTARHPIFAKFAILSTPPGFAPEEIRREWVGLELPVRSESEKGVPIVATEALEHLRNGGRTAASQWWYKYYEGEGHEVFWLRALLNPLTMVRKDCLANIGHLVFEKSCGELTPIHESH